MSTMMSLGMVPQVQVSISDWMSCAVALPHDGSEFVIGDVHGRAECLEPLLEAMGAASDGSGHLTMLGDLCDRGPASLRCYELAYARAPGEMSFSGRTAIIGNHEIFLSMMLMGGSHARKVFALWIQNGGGHVRFELIRAGYDCEGPEQTSSALVQALGPDVVQTVLDSASHRRTGNLVMVHAGISPRVSMDRWFARQKLEIYDENHFAWIRFPFFGYKGDYEQNVQVVHGHTFESNIRSWKGLLPAIGYHRFDGARLGLDAGSFQTGLVAGAEFKNGFYRIFVSGENAVDRVRGARLDAEVHQRTMKNV